MGRCWCRTSLLLPSDEWLTIIFIQHKYVERQFTKQNTYFIDIWVAGVGPRHCLPSANDLHEAGPGHSLGWMIQSTSQEHPGWSRVSSMSKKYMIDGKVVRSVFIEDKYIGREFYKPKNLLYRWVDSEASVISWLPSDEWLTIIFIQDKYVEREFIGQKTYFIVGVGPRHYLLSADDELCPTLVQAILSGEVLWMILSTS
jgi:hypothetical protein